MRTRIAVLLFYTASAVVLSGACSGESDLERRIDEYDVVEEGNAGSVTTAIPPGTTPALTDTNMDTTTSLTLVAPPVDPTATTPPPGPGTLAETLGLDPSRAAAPPPSRPPASPVAVPAQPRPFAEPPPRPSRAEPAPDRETRPAPTRREAEPEPEPEAEPQPEPDRESDPEPPPARESEPEPAPERKSPPPPDEPPPPPPDEKPPGDAESDEPPPHGDPIH